MRCRTIYFQDNEISKSKFVRVKKMNYKVIDKELS